MDRSTQKHFLGQNFWYRRKSPALDFSCSPPLTFKSMSSLLLMTKMLDLDFQREKDICTKLMLQSMPISCAVWDSVTSNGPLFSHNAAAHAFIDRSTPSRSLLCQSIFATIFLCFMQPPRRQRNPIVCSGLENFLYHQCIKLVPLIVAKCRIVDLSFFLQDPKLLLFASLFASKISHTRISMSTSCLPTYSFSFLMNVHSM